MFPRVPAQFRSLPRLAAGCVVGLALMAPGLVLDGAARANQAPTPSAASSEAPARAAAMSDAERDRQAEAIARSIMSPFCPGRTVSACPNAGPWRDDIRRWVGEGVDAIEIKRRLAERVPQHDLAGIPQNRLGWVLPAGLALGAVGILVFLLRYLVGPRPPGGGTGASPSTGREASKPAGGSKALRKSPNDKAAREASSAPGVSGAPVAGTPVTGAPGKDGADTANAGPNANKVDWDARLERELETLDN